MAKRKMAKREISLTKHYTELTMDIHDPHKNGDEPVLH